MEKAEDEIAALKHLGLVQNDALRVLIEHVRALTVVNGALLLQLGARIDRGAIRKAAHEVLEHHGHVPGGLAGTLVEAITCDPAEQQDATGTNLTKLSARLQ